MEHIVPGPSIVGGASDEEVARAIERAMNPGAAVRAANRTNHPARAAAARLFVGNLDFDTDEAMLKELFKEAGFPLAEATVVRDRDTGQSRGFAFVEVAKPEDAPQAIEVLDGAPLSGRRLRINMAEERNRR